MIVEVDIISLKLRSRLKIPSLSKEELFVHVMVLRQICQYVSPNGFKVVLNFFS